MYIGSDGYERHYTEKGIVRQPSEGLYRAVEKHP